MKTTEEKAKGLDNGVSTSTGGRNGGGNGGGSTTLMPVKGTDTRDYSVLALIRENPSITQKEISKILRISENTVLRAINSLKASGILVRQGSTKKGIWAIQDTDR